MNKTKIYTLPVPSGAWLTDLSRQVDDQEALM